MPCTTPAWVLVGWNQHVDESKLEYGFAVMPVVGYALVERFFVEEPDDRWTFVSPMIHEGKDIILVEDEPSCLAMGHSRQFSAEDYAEGRRVLEIQHQMAAIRRSKAMEGAR